MNRLKDTHRGQGLYISYNDWKIFSFYNQLYTLTQKYWYPLWNIAWTHFPHILKPLRADLHPLRAQTQTSTLTVWNLCEHTVHPLRAQAQTSMPTVWNLCVHTVHPLRAQAQTSMPPLWNLCVHRVHPLRARPKSDHYESKSGWLCILKAKPTGTWQRQAHATLLHCDCALLWHAACCPLFLWFAPASSSHEWLA